MGEHKIDAHIRRNSSASRVFVWALGFVVLLLALAVGGLWWLYLQGGAGAAEAPTPTLILRTATATPAPSPAAAATPAETVQPTPAASSGIAVGRHVQVTNTGGYGLSLREGPGENYTRMDVALDGEVFIVVDGPTIAGGSEWWRLRDPENEEREWWAVGNFLKPVEQP